MLPQRYFDRFYDWIVRPVQNEQDLAWVNNMDHSNFGTQAALPTELLKSWHDSYPFGLRLLCHDDWIFGYISLWPITSQQASELAAGRLFEKDLCPIPSKNVQADGTNHWYIGGMVIDPTLRKPFKGNPIGMILAMALNSWAESGVVTYPTEVYSIAFSSEGAALLSRLGFTEIKTAQEMPDGFSLYRRAAPSKNGLFEIFAQRGIPHLFSGD